MSVKPDPTNPSICGICGTSLKDADDCLRMSCPYEPMTLTQRVEHRASSIKIMREIAEEQAVREPVDPRTDLQVQLEAFEKAYWIAANSSLPDDWFEAAMIGKQLANEVRKELDHDD